MPELWPLNTQYLRELIEAHVADAGVHGLSFEEAAALAEERNNEAALQLEASVLDLEAAAAVAAEPAPAI